MLSSRILPGSQHLLLGTDLLGDTDRRHTLSYLTQLVLVALGANVAVLVLVGKHH
jgi:hypothetical protein